MKSDPPRSHLFLLGTETCKRLDAAPGHVASDRPAVFEVHDFTLFINQEVGRHLLCLRHVHVLRAAVCVAHAGSAVSLSTAQRVETAAHRRGESAVHAGVVAHAAAQRRACEGLLALPLLVGGALLVAEQRELGRGLLTGVRSHLLAVGVEDNQHHHAGALQRLGLLLSLRNPKLAHHARRVTQKTQVHLLPFVVGEVNGIAIRVAELQTGRGFANSHHCCEIGLLLLL
mmetsp:Transcript_9020/g.22008  ORF Transcript_9020/g.22008 Transcript_9020/m.22008 type:complete len:229 (-) Transcript_9020:168-854(-)